MRPIRLLSTLLLMVACACAVASPREWTLDPVHTRIVFAVDHAGFSKALGTFSGATGRLSFDPDDWRGARLEVSVPLASLELGDARWNRATLARNLLDVANHEQAIFRSTSVEPVEANRMIVHGLLELRGVSREVQLDVVLNAIKRHPMPPFRRTAGFSATAMLSRTAFGIDAWPTMIGDAVELRIEAEATLARGNDNAPPHANDVASDPANEPETSP